MHSDHAFVGYRPYKSILTKFVNFIITVFIDEQRKEKSF